MRAADGPAGPLYLCGPIILRRGNPGLQAGVAFTPWHSYRAQNWTASDADLGAVTRELSSGRTLDQMKCQAHVAFDRGQTAPADIFSIPF